MVFMCMCECVELQIFSIGHCTLYMYMHMHSQDVIHSITWRGVRKMPKRLECAQSVVLHGSVYVGSERTIFQYSIDEDQWRELPCRPPQKDFSMTVFNDNLVLVGGLEVSGIFSQYYVSNKLSVWDQNSKKWTHPYPCIPAARYAVSSVGYKSYLIIAGGRERVPEDSSLISHQIEVPSLSTVEILDSATSTWYSGDPLPFECHAMQTSVFGDTLYLLGGRNRFDFVKSVVWASLPRLISKACQPSPTCTLAATTSNTTPYCWHVLPPCPYFTSSAPYYSSNRGDGNTHVDHNYGDNATNTCTNVPLLAIGGHTGLQVSLLGECDTARISREIHAHSHVTGGWVRIEGDLPEACVGCSCCVLPSGQLFVAGGGRFASPLTSAYIGTFQK
jgi:hypothetical protein